jgi:phenylalanyl-tRNA synthetase beta chain
MKISLQWLRELVELPPTTEALVDLLTLAGVEVEGVETRGCAIDGVIVAQIRESAQHPNADRLSVCQVDDGTGTARQIVCGAKNYKVGDKVPLALPGAKLGADFTIKVGKLRGVESQGMMCSAKELGIAEDAEGLLLLPADSAVGTPIGALFPADTVLDLEITPNRADLLSVNGIAREIGALLGTPVRLAGPKAPPPALPLATLSVTAADCPLYTARKISGVKVGPSPDWLKRRLEAVGLRSINNVVDVTNFTMLELGEPLHAFDAAKLRGALNVRPAREGEEFLALDGKTYKLAANHMVIADVERALAIAGVMGGEDSGVTEATTEIWLESAYFVPQSIRRTSRQLGLASDSSYRFERGVDPCTIVEASQRATELLVELCGGQAGELTVGQPAGAAGSASAAFPLRRADYKSTALSFRPARLAALLGVDVAEARIDSILTAFGLAKSADGWHVPSFRPDLTREIDIIEEVARVVGMEVIPARVQARIVGASATDAAYDRAMALRRALVAQGLHEARSVALVPASPRGLGFTQIAPERLLRVKNPMIDDQVVLRPGLLHGLLHALTTNVRAGAAGVRLFEIGRIYHAATDADASEEAAHAAVVISGPISERNWRAAEGRAADLYDLKGILTAALGSGATFPPEENPALALALRVEVNGQAIGFAGQLWPADARALDATAPVLFAEIDLSRLAAAQAQEPSRKYRDIPRFPAVTRDIALLAPLSLSHAAIESALHASREPLLTNVALFDVFTDASGARVPAGKKSVAYSLTYRAADRTLTADEVNVAHARLKEQLQTQLGVTLRE